jgi:hypothetical protein
VDQPVYTVSMTKQELREIASLLNDATRYNHIASDDTRFERAVTLANWFDGMANALEQKEK